VRTAFVCGFPLDQVSAFSGIPYYMSRAIQAASESFESISVSTPGYDVNEVVQRGVREVRGELKRSGQLLSKSLRELDVDVVICQGSSMIPYLETDKPIAFWHDATVFSLMRMDFEEFKVRYPFLYEFDSLIFEKYDLIAFAAAWVRDQTLKYYTVAPEKLCVIPFGANLDTVSQETVEKSINERSRVPCRLTFLGIEWQRKGLPLAYEVPSKLNATGLGAKLTTIGCDVPKAGSEREPGQIGDPSSKDVKQFQRRFHSDLSVNKVGFLDKSNPWHYRLLSQILQKTHFLLHPAHFEAFGIALVEANAFGVPVIATDHYGPQTIVRNGVNGRLFKPDEYADQATDFILHQMEDYEAYKSLAQSSFAEYRDRLNWSTSVQKLKEKIQELST
jgi:glycosyltransferase involved in cell wall biosynthesis